MYRIISIICIACAALVWAPVAFAGGLGLDDEPFTAGASRAFDLQAVAAQEGPSELENEVSLNPLASYQLAANVGLELVQWTEYVDRYGDWAARGQIRNNGGDTAYHVRVKVDLSSKSNGSFYSNEYTFANGSNVCSKFGNVSETAIAPGETVTFDIKYTDAPSSEVKAGRKWLDYSYYGPELTLMADPQVTEFNQYTYYGEWAARGRVQNFGSARAYFTTVRADCFDAGEQYIGGDYTYIDGYTAVSPVSGITTDTTVGPGETASYNIRFTDISPSAVKSAKTRVNWNEYTYSTSSEEEAWALRLESSQQAAQLSGGPGLSQRF